MVFFYYNLAIFSTASRSSIVLSGSAGSEGTVGCLFFLGLLGQFTCQNKIPWGESCHRLILVCMSECVGREERYKKM